MIGTDTPDAWADRDGTVHGEREGSAVLDEVARFLSRFVAFPDHALTAVTLWAAHAHVVHCGENTPRLALLSPEPGSGKTRTLEVLETLAPQPMPVLNASAPAIFRSMQDEQPTLLFDEVDAIFGRHGKDDPAEDLRALLNAGHRKGARIPRCVGPKHEVQHFPVFGAVALAGLGDLPETLMSRSVVIRMRRRAPGELVEPFRARLHHPEGKRLVEWLTPLAETIGRAFPDMPPGVTDRPADCWEPLLAVADAAGGEWPQRARDACVALVNAARGTDTGSLGIRLLADLRAVFGDKEALSTETILSELHKIEEAPWGDLRGKPLDPRGLANRLRAYGIGSTKVKVGGRALQGYRREDLWDAWQRYLGAPDPASPEPPEPLEPERDHRWSQPHGQVPDEVLPARAVPEPPTQVEPTAPPLTCDVPTVPQVPDLQTPKGAPEPERTCIVCGYRLDPALGDDLVRPLCDTNPEDGVFSVLDNRVLLSVVDSVVERLVNAGYTESHVRGIVEQKHARARKHHDPNTLYWSVIKELPASSTEEH